jgi:hypothetical protein
VQLGIMSMLNIRSKSVEASTCTTITGGASNYEIALVLDNSGSMNESVSGNSKIAALRTAATNFINTMFNGPFTGKVKMSIVPFAGLVSLSSNDTSNGSASWIDTQGKPSWHWKTFKNHSTVGFTNRLDIFKNLKAVNSDWAWAGCFETQPYPQNVTSSGGSGTTTPTDDQSLTTRSCKYKSPSVTNTNTYGPNGMCLSQPLQRLTPSQPTLLNKIRGLTCRRQGV